MADLVFYSQATGGSLRGTMRRRVGPPDGYTHVEEGRHKVAYWTSGRLRAVIRALLVFEYDHGREHPTVVRERLSLLDAQEAP